MRAFQVTKHDHPANIIPSDVPAPVPTKGEILIDVYALGSNFFDILQAQNKYQLQPPLPFILGFEFAGRINQDAVIPEGCSLKPGDRVFGAAQGAYAEQVCVHHTSLIPIPNGFSYDEAAGICVTWPTSYEGLVGRGQVQAGETVLVHAGAGGVGLPAIQIAKSLGCKVIATASSAAKLRVCLEKGGADHAVDYSKNWQAEVLKLTNGKGVDCVYDPVGLLVPSLKVAAWKCRLVVVGFAGGSIEKVPANLLLVKNVSVVGLHWGAYLKKEPSRPPVVWSELFQGFDSGAYKPIVFEGTYRGLSSVSRALKDIESRKTWGKVAVRVRQDDGTVYPDEPEPSKL